MFGDETIRGLAFERLPDSYLLWADLVMNSGMPVQKDDIRPTLIRALGKRTMSGGPYASREPQVSLRLADYVVVGNERKAAIAEPTKDEMLARTAEHEKSLGAKKSRNMESSV